MRGSRADDVEILDESSLAGFVDSPLRGSRRSERIDDGTGNSRLVPGT